MEVPTLSEPSQQPCTNRKEMIYKLCSQDDGLAVVCETIVTLFQFDRDTGNGLGQPDQETEVVDSPEAGENWTPIYYGIPGIFADKSRLVICLFDLESDDHVREFTIHDASQYTPVSDHFSVIGVSKNTYYGLSFADVAVAVKVQAIISLVFPNIALAANEREDSMSPAVKRRKISVDGESDPNGEEEWVIIEPGDVLELSEHQEFDSVDSPGIFSHLGTKQKTLQAKATPSVISEPTDFKHISHVGLDSSVGELTRSMKGEYMSEPSQETETSSSISEVAIPPPLPPPVAPPPPTLATGTLKPGNKLFPSLQDELAKGVLLKSVNGSLPGGGAPGDIAQELKRGIMLRPVGTLGKYLPKPPPLINHGKLLFEINTFKRKALRHVETVTDYQEDDPNALQSVLKSALEKMKGKLSMYDFSRVASVNSEGGESGFGDEIDGPLFV